MGPDGKVQVCSRMCPNYKRFEDGKEITYFDYLEVPESDNMRSFDGVQETIL